MIASTLKDIPLITSFDAARIESDKFQHSLASDLKEHQPGKVSIDPLYVYQGGKVDTQSLYARGEMLSWMSRPVVEADAVLSVVDHWSKTGSGDALNRMTQAGMGEWAQTWLMLSHREPPDVENGVFRLFLEIGSREWGGSHWELDIEVGQFDEDLRQHIGDISWAIRRTSAEAVAGGTKRPAGQGRIDYDERIVQLLRDKPWELTQTEITKALGDSEGVREAFNRMKAGERPAVIFRKLPKTEKGRSVRRDLWANAGEPRVLEDDEPVVEADID